MADGNTHAAIPVRLPAEQMVPAPAGKRETAQGF